MSSPHSSNRAAYSRRTVLRLAGGVTLALAVGACGGDGGGDDASGSGSADEAVTNFTIVAKNIAWDRDRIVVPARQEVTATIDNRDRGILHNLHIRSPGDPKSQLETGPVTQTLRFTIDDPGSYGFLCDAHPNMTGTIVAV